MKIYLLRHGIAEEERAGRADSERALTHEGREKLRETLAAARKADLTPSLVISSPYQRAVETAAIAMEVLGKKGDSERSTALVPGSRPEAVWDIIRLNREETEVLLVSHQPLCSTTTGYLLSAPNLLVDFKKGAMVRIDVMSFGPTPRGELKWFLTPKLVN